MREAVCDFWKAAEEELAKKQRKETRRHMSVHVRACVRRQSLAPVWSHLRVCALYTLPRTCVYFQRHYYEVIWVWFPLALLRCECFSDICVFNSFQQQQLVLQS